MKTLLINEFDFNNLDSHDQLAMIADERIVQVETVEKIKKVTDKVNELFQWIHVECKPIGEIKMKNKILDLIEARITQLNNERNALGKPDDFSLIEVRYNELSKVITELHYIHGLVSIVK